MRTFEKIAAGGMIVALLLVMIMLWVKGSEPVEGSTINLGPALQSATTSQGFTVSSSIRILATTTTSDPTSTYTRLYASICTQSANPIAVFLGNDKAAGTSTMTAYIAAAAGYDSCYFIDDTNPYNGAVTASSTAPSSLLSVSDYVW